MTSMPFLREATTSTVIVTALFPGTVNLQSFRDRGSGSSAGSYGVGLRYAHFVAESLEHQTSCGDCSV